MRDNQRHTIKIIIGPKVFDTVVSLDGEMLPNVTNIQVNARHGRATVEITMEGVEVIVEGDMPRKKVDTRTEIYELE